MMVVGYHDTVKNTLYIRYCTYIQTLFYSILSLSLSLHFFWEIMVIACVQRKRKLMEVVLRGRVAVTMLVVWWACCSTASLATTEAASAVVERGGDERTDMWIAAPRHVGIRKEEEGEEEEKYSRYRAAASGTTSHVHDADARLDMVRRQEDEKTKMLHLRHHAAAKAEDAQKEYVDVLVDADALLAAQDAEDIRDELHALRRGDTTREYGLLRECGQGIAAAVVLVQGAPRDYIVPGGGVNRDDDDDDDDVLRRRAQTPAGAAKLLHDTWGLGADACGGNGMLILVSIDERAIEFSTGRAASQLLPDSFLQRVVEAMKPNLRRGKVADALLLALRACGRFATGQNREEVARLLLDATNVARRGNAESEYDFFSQTVSIVVLFLAQFIFAAIQNSIGMPRRRREQHRWTRCMKLLKDIERSADDTAHGTDTAVAEHGPNYEMSICSICLESFDNEKEEEEEEDDDDDADDDNDTEQRHGEEQRPRGATLPAEEEATTTATSSPTPTSVQRRGFFVEFVEHLDRNDADQVAQGLVAQCAEFMRNLEARVRRWISRMYDIVQAYAGGNTSGSGRSGDHATATALSDADTSTKRGQTGKLKKKKKPQIVRINLECGHSFCRSCLSEWFKSKTTCPLCREECHVRLRSIARSTTVGAASETASPLVVDHSASTAGSHGAEAAAAAAATATTDMTANTEGGLLGRLSRYVRTSLFGSGDTDEEPASFAEQRRDDASAWVRDIAHDADGLDIVAEDAARATGGQLMYSFGLRRLQRMYPSFIDSGMISNLRPTQRLSREVSFLNRCPQRQTTMARNNFHSSSASSFSAFGGGSSRGGGGVSGRW